MAHKTEADRPHITEREKTPIVEIVETLSQGQVPPTETFKKELEPTKEFLMQKEKSATTLEQEEMFRETRKFMSALEETIETKNLGDRLNALISAANRVTERTIPATAQAPEMWKETREFISSLRDLVPQLLRSKQFRISILNFFKVFRDIFHIEEKKEEAKGKLEEAFVEGRSPTETFQEIAQETTEKMKELKIEELPPEQKQKIRDNLKELMRTLRQHTDAAYSFRKLINLWSILNTQFTAHLMRAKVDRDVQEVIDRSIELVEVFAGRKVDDFLAKVNRTLEFFQNDPELQSYLDQFRAYILDGLENPDLLESDDYYDRGEELIRKGRQLAEKYKNEPILQDVVDSSSELVEAIKSDEQLRELQYRAQKIAEAFTYTDITGKKHVDTDLVSAMRKELVPFLIQRIKEVPVPGFTIQSEDFEYLIVDDLYVILEEIIPDKIHIHSRNDTDITMKNLENPVKSETIIKFKLEGLRPHFKDFYFRFKRKGLIQIADEGRANLRVTGKGVSIYITFDVDVDTEGRALLGNKADVDVMVDYIELEVTQAEHKTLLNFVSGFFEPRLRVELRNALKKRIEEIGSEWATYLNKRVLSALSLPKIGETITGVVKESILP